jgi:hypothetical protein
MNAGEILSSLNPTNQGSKNLASFQQFYKSVIADIANSRKFIV